MSIPKDIISSKERHQNMKWFDAGTKKMSVSTFGCFIKLMKLPCTAAWVSPRNRALEGVKVSEMSSKMWPIEDEGR